MQRVITCSDGIIKKRLKSRDKSRKCDSDDYIKRQLDYQRYLLSILEFYQFHIDGSDISVSVIVRKIIDYIQKVKDDCLVKNQIGNK